MRMQLPPTYGYVLGASFACSLREFSRPCLSMRQASASVGAKSSSSYAALGSLQVNSSSMRFGQHLLIAVKRLFIDHHRLDVPLEEEEPW